MSELTPRAFLSDFRANARTFAVLAYVAAALTLAEFVFLSSHFAEFFPQFTRVNIPAWWYGSFEAASRAGVKERGPWWGALMPQAWWTGGTLVLWVLVPLVFARVSGIKDLGLSLRGFAGKWWLYGALFAVMLPGVLWASTQEGFLRTYPFLKPWACANWCWLVLLCYWGLYALQFVAVEFFFRGFMCFGLEREFGLGAIGVMVVPYCMIHFHKPLPEALGAIVAGFVLGWLALKTRSIWGGVCLHIAVAFSMDALALWRSGSFPDRLF
ncbi:MAG: CPBP family intramembrane metalloprotease [Planctomycetes bacterium]|nr:CPBP family intramembrane metalloprotease [Planctomycetota bacterium]